MKKVALYLAFLFTLVQMGPGIKALFTESPVVVLFATDEEKNADGEKGENHSEKKNNLKEFFALQRNVSFFSVSLFSCIHDNSAAISDPLIDILTPPPNRA